MPNPKRHVYMTTKVGHLKGVEIFLRDTMHVQHLHITPEESGNLKISGCYVTGVGRAYQIWAHGHPNGGGIYLGVVFRLEEHANQWCVVDKFGYLWGSYAATRTDAIQHAMGRYFT